MITQRSKHECKAEQHIVEDARSTMESISEILVQTNKQAKKANREKREKTH